MMKLIEAIQIKSFSEIDRDKALHLLREMVVKGADIPQKIRLFNSQSLPTDFCVCLYWDKELCDSYKSDLAEKLSAALKKYGWIAHTIWKPLEEGPSCFKRK